MIDLRRLPSVAQLELRAYERVLGSSLLSTKARATIEALHGHEQAHARALAKLGAHHASPDLSRLRRDLRTETDCLLVLIAAEEIALGASYDAMEHLTDARALRVAAEMMAAEAQHRAVLSELLSPGDVMAALPASRVVGIG